MIIATDLSKQQKLDADSKSKQQISFTGNLDKTENTILFIAEKAKKELFQIFHKEP